MGKAAIIYNTGLMVQVVKAGKIYHTGLMLQIGPKYFPDFFSKGCDTGPPHNIETTSLYYISYVEVSVQSLISPLFEFYKPYFSIHIQTLVGQNVNIKNIEFLLRLICTLLHPGTGYWRIFIRQVIFSRRACKKIRLSATTFAASVMGSVNVYPWGV